MTKRPGPGLSATLATATCTLLGTTAATAVHAEEADEWDFDTALLYYGESDDRVQDASLTVLANRHFTDDRSLSLGLTVDALTGATPNGAIRIGEAQTFTRPSGNSAYAIAPEALPLDDTFRDTRYALTAGWKQPLGRLNTFGVGVSVSSEYDYTHAGLDTQFARDFNDRNTTLSLALAIARDEIDPVGGTPLELSPMLDVGDLSNRRGAETKDVADVVIGLTQVISRTTLVQVNYSWSDSSGYLTDPYKVLSIVDPETGVTLPRAMTPGVDGPSHEVVYESRPDSRSKQSFYGQVRKFMNGKVLDVSYRYMTDDWDIDSHTVDTHLRWPVGAASYLEPHLRYYTQTEASFYSPSLAADVPIPDFASSDYRLGRFQALTAGLKYGWQTRRDHEMSVRLEWYQQRGDVPGDLLIGEQSTATVYPDLDAVIAQFSYKF